MEEFVLEAVDITKRFPGVVANENVCLQVKKGEIMGLIGENGAGKSTILKILNGVYPYGTYEGVLKLSDKEIRPVSPLDAMKEGIGFVPQEINVLKCLSVAENIYMGDLSIGKKSWIVNHKDVYAAAEKLLEENQIDLDPRADVRKLSIGQQQMLMIARALSTNPRVLILDEPTTSLSNKDVENLFNVVRKLKEKGTSIIFVTHKLAEILELTDRVTILRDGKNVGIFSKEEYDKEKIITGMIGRKITNMYPKRDVQIGEEVLRVEGMTVEHPYIADRNLIENVSFFLRKGEVLGLAGLVGAGRTEVLNALFGVYKMKKGRVMVNGKEVRINSPKEAKKNGMALVTEDRKKFGLLFLSRIKKNISINNLGTISRLGFISPKTESAKSAKYFEHMKIKAPSIETGVIALSGGNQQKVVIGRSLNAEPSIVILDEPTKGIDVGSKNEIYMLINELVAMGVSVIMVSSELPELIEMCDRFVVMAGGRVSGELSKEEATDSRVMMLAVKSNALD